jgi:hypothetical protein
MGDYTQTERAARMKAKRQAEGWKMASVWTPGANLEALREAFPGSRGGVDWEAVIKAALSVVGRKPTENHP